MLPREASEAFPEAALGRRSPALAEMSRRSGGQRRLRDASLGRAQRVCAPVAREGEMRRLRFLGDALAFLPRAAPPY